jgi:hypothetical protein
LGQWEEEDEEEEEEEEEEGEKEEEEEEEEEEEPDFSKIDLSSSRRPPKSTLGHVTVCKSVLGHMTVTKYWSALGHGTVSS